MQIDGKEFIRNVGIEQDKERLIQEQHKLEESKRASIQREQNHINNEPKEEESAFVDLSINDTPSPAAETPNAVNDILLTPQNNVNNKKKYIILGMGLVILFIITILVIRLMSNSETQNKFETSEPTQEEVIKDEILNKIDSNEEYQKVIDRKNELDKLREEEKKEKKIIADMAVPEQETNNVPLVIDTPKQEVETKRDLFGLDKEANVEVVQPKKIVPKPVVKKVVKAKPVEVKKEKKVVKKQVVLSKPKREIIVPPANETDFTKKTTTLKGYFVQIGAFTRAPSSTLLKDVKRKGYNYKIYKLTIKGRLYNKLLIGPYKTRANALRNLSQIKSDFKNPNAYILKL